MNEPSVTGDDSRREIGVSSGVDSVVWAPQAAFPKQVTKWARQDSNLRPWDYESDATPGTTGHHVDKRAENRAFPPLPFSTVSRSVSNDGQSTGKVSLPFECLAFRLQPPAGFLGAFARKGRIG